MHDRVANARERMFATRVTVCAHRADARTKPRARAR
jgi:hypothetical protein